MTLEMNSRYVSVALKTKTKVSTVQVLGHALVAVAVDILRTVSSGS